MGSTVSRRAVRIVLVDDHAVVREGYRRLLELSVDMAVVAEFADAESFDRALCDGRIEPDVVVLDLSLPGMSGLDLLRRLQMRRPRPKVLVFTMHDSAAVVDRSLRAGACGFVTKSSEPEVLIDAVRQVHRGERPVSADVVQHAASPAGPEPHASLSPREFSVLLGLVKGQTVDQIATTLDISSKTASNYQTLVRRKLGLRSAVDVVRYAEQYGLAPH